MRDNSLSLPLDVSRETRSKLIAFSQNVLAWSQRINLVSPISERDFWTRHIEDSAQLDALESRSVGEWVDLGSGGGLPGIVLAILGLEKRPGTQYTLIESDTRKAAFLKLQCKEFDIRGKVLTERVEAAKPLNADTISARAFAPLPKLLSLAHPHLAAEARLLLPKGRQYDAELQIARQVWEFDCDVRSNRVEPDGRILLIWNVRKKGAIE